MSFDFANSTVADYLKQLASAAPAPGGGAAAALSGAQGAALVTMVANLTIGNEKYKDYDLSCRTASAQTTALLQWFLTLMERDADAFSGYSTASRLPRGTDEQKAARTEAMQTALQACAEAPLETLRAASKGVALCKTLVGRSNPTVASDLFVAASLFRSCAESAAENVAVNLAYLKDQKLSDKLRDEAGKLLASVRKGVVEIGEKTKTR